MLNYQRPNNLDTRITDEMYEKIVDISCEEAENCIMNGRFDFYMRRACLATAREVLNQLEDLREERR